MANNKYNFDNNGYTDLNDLKKNKSSFNGVDDLNDVSLTGESEADIVDKQRSHNVSNPFLKKTGNGQYKVNADYNKLLKTDIYNEARSQLQKDKQQLATLDPNSKEAILIKANIKRNEKIVEEYSRSLMNRNAFKEAMNRKANKKANENYSEAHNLAYKQAQEINNQEYKNAIDNWSKTANKLQDEIAELEKKKTTLNNEGRVVNPYQYNSIERQIKTKERQLNEITKKMQGENEYAKREANIQRQIQNEIKEKEIYDKKQEVLHNSAPGKIFEYGNKVNDKVTNTFIDVSKAPARAMKHAGKKAYEGLKQTKFGQAVADSGISHAINNVKEAVGTQTRVFSRQIGQLKNKFGDAINKFFKYIFQIVKAIASFLFSNPLGWVCLAIIVIFNLILGMAVREAIPEDNITSDEAQIAQQINAHSEQEDLTQLKAFKARVESKRCYYENEDTENETYVCENYVPEGASKTYTSMFYDDYHVVVNAANIVPIIWTWKSDELWDAAANEEAKKINDDLKPGEDGYIGTKNYWINVVNNYWDKVGLNERELKSLFIKRVDYKYQYLTVEWSKWSNVPQTESDALEKDSEALETFNNNIANNNDQYRQVNGKCYWVETVEHEAETATRNLTTSEINNLCNGLKGSKLRACKASHKNDTTTYTVKDAWSEDITHYETCTYNQGRKATKISWTQDSSNATKIYNTVDEEGRTIYVTERTSFINWDGKHDGNWFVEYLGDINANQTDYGNYSIKRIKTFKTWTKEEVYYLLTHEYYPQNDYISIVQASWNSADTIHITNDNSGNPDDHPFPEGFDKGDSTYFGEKEINYTPLETDEGIEAHDLNPTNVVDYYIQDYSVSKKHIYVDWYHDDDIIAENYWKSNSLAEFEKDLRAYYEILAQLGHDIDVAFLEGKIFISPFYTTCELDDDNKISSTISQHFGATGTVSTEFSGQSNHGAIDFTDAGVANACNVSQGWQINASQSGTVVGTKNSNCYNSTSDTACYVKIQSEVEAADGETYYIEHWYWHVTEGSVTVSTGDDVIAGDEIATVGNTGYSTGPHVHFETAIWSEKPSWWGTAAPFAEYKEHIFDSEPLIQFSNSDIGSTDDMETVIPQSDD